MDDDEDREFWQMARKRAFLMWRTAHMSKWVELERAKGRPESELVWGNCIRETGVLVSDRSNRQFIDPHMGTLVPLPDTRDVLAWVSG